MVEVGSLSHRDYLIEVGAIAVRLVLVMVDQSILWRILDQTGPRVRGDR